MSVQNQHVEAFRNRVVGRRIKENTYNVYEPWVKRYEMWRSGGEPTLGGLIDFDSMLADAERSEYPWEYTTGRKQPDGYAYRTRVVALSAAKLWSRVHYDARIEEEVQHIAEGEPAPFDPPYLSRDDVARVLASAEENCNNPDCEAMLHLTYDALLRCAEVVTVEREDIDLDRGTLDVRPVKGGLNMTVGLSRETVEVLRSHLRDDAGRGKVFTNTYGNGWKPTSWSTHFRDYHHEVGAHSFGRHSPIMHRLSAPAEFETMDQDGDPFGQTYRRSRHHHPSMTTRYARLLDTEVPDWAGDDTSGTVA
jgi:integrase